MPTPYIDGAYSPFDDYLGYSSMAPCYRDCDHYIDFNVRALLLSLRTQCTRRIYLHHLIALSQPLR